MASDSVFSVFSVNVERVNKRYMMTYDMNTIALSMSRIHQNGSTFLLKYNPAIFVKKSPLLFELLLLLIIIYSINRN